jgi:hypothetical protein
MITVKLFLYPLYAISSWAFTLIAYIFAPIICLAVNSEGNLPAYLSWFGTPDNPAIGDVFWKERHSDYSNYQLTVTWMWRNPAQGFDQFVKAKVDYSTPVKVFGNINIDDSAKLPIGGWFLITGDGYFQLQIIVSTAFGCFESHWGWSLKPLAKGYIHPTLGALLATPFRFYKAR